MASQSCYNEGPQGAWFKNHEIYCLMVEARSPTLRDWQGCSFCVLLFPLSSHPWKSLTWGHSTSDGLHHSTMFSLSVFSLCLSPHHCCCFETVSCSPSSWAEAINYLDLLSFLPPAPTCWDYGFAILFSNKNTIQSIENYNFSITCRGDANQAKPGGYMEVKTVENKLRQHGIEQCLQEVQTDSVLPLVPGKVLWRSASRPCDFGAWNSKANLTCKLCPGESVIDLRWGLHLWWGLRKQWVIRGNSWV